MNYKIISISLFILAAPLLNAQPEPQKTTPSTAKIVAQNNSRSTAEITDTSITITPSPVQIVYEVQPGWCACLKNIILHSTIGFVSGSVTGAGCALLEIFSGREYRYLWPLYWVTEAGERHAIGVAIDEQMQKHHINPSKIRNRSALIGSWTAYLLLKNR